MNADEIMALLNTAADIAQIAVPEICRSGFGSAVEQRIVDLLTHALNCLTRARVLAEGDVHNVASITDGIAVVAAALAEHKAELASWLEVDRLGLVAEALDEARGKTLH